MSADGKSPLMTRLLQLTAIIVAIISIALTVAARKKELTCEYIGRARLVSVTDSGIPAEVRMEYRGEAVQSLTKLNFIVRNSGAAAVKAEDVRDPLKLVFPPSVRVLSASVERTAPQPFSALLRVSADQHEVSLEFPLLNSGDNAAIAVYIINSEPLVPDFRGRVVDVSRLVFVNSATTEPSLGRFTGIKSHAVRTVLYWVLVGCFSAIAVLLSVFIVSDVFMFFRLALWRRRWGSQYYQLFPQGRRSEESKQESAESMRKLKQAGIPRRPWASAESFVVVVVRSIAAGGIATMAGFSAYLIHVVLRG